MNGLQKYIKKFFFRSLDLRSQISKRIMWIISKSHREFFFFDIFAIHSSSRHEKRCQMSLRLFSLFRGSIYQQCLELVRVKLWECIFLVTLSRTTDYYLFIKRKLSVNLKITSAASTPSYVNFCVTLIFKTFLRNTLLHSTIYDLVSSMQVGGHYD